jgi:hypothetical protein
MAAERRRDRTAGPTADDGLDDSPYAFPTTTGPLAPFFAAISDFIEAGVNEGTQNKDDLAWARWRTFCNLAGTTPWRMDSDAHAGRNAVGFARECRLLCAYFVWVHSLIKPRSSADAAAKPDSSLNMITAVRRIHGRHGVTMVACKQLGALMRGITERHIREHGSESLLPNRKEPIDPPLLRRLLTTIPQQLGDQYLDWEAPLFVCLAAMFALAGGTGFRKSETATPNSMEFDERRLRRSSVLWKLDGAILVDPSAEQLSALVPLRDMCIVKPCRSKADQTNRVFGAHPIYLRYDPSDPANPAARLRTLELRLPCRGKARLTTALFVSDAAFTPMKHSTVDCYLAQILRANVSAAEASRYSFHSFRIGFACCLLAAGCPYDMIQALARWRSTQSLTIYARLNPAAYADWVDKALLQKADSTTARRLPVIDDHDVVAVYASAADVFERAT